MQLTFEQYVLIGSTVRSYLAWMKDKGEMQAEINDNMLFWKKIDIIFVTFVKKR